MYSWILYDCSCRVLIVDRLNLQYAAELMCPSSSLLLAPAPCLITRRTFKRINEKGVWVR
jgi:hypothetical protein